MYSNMSVSLVDYPRATKIAAGYQYYRINSVKMTYKPTFDTFSGTQSKMNLYYMLDKSGSLPTNINLEGLKQMGARPRQLDEKNVVITYKPSVLEATMYAPGLGNNVASKYKLSPWLATTAAPETPGAFVANGVDHLGIYYFVEQLIASSPPATFEIDIEVQFQFKKPLADNISSVYTAIPAVVATLNDSKDGIVGGVDGV